MEEFYLEEKAIKAGGGQVKIIGGEKLFHGAPSFKNLYSL